MIDLQMHSTFSDGSMTPTELVQMAQKMRLTAIALTDHDTIEGIPEFLKAGEQFGVSVVPGVEISVDTKLPNHGHMHILGLFIDPSSGGLGDTLNFLRTERNIRAEKIVKKLQELNVPITMQELEEEAGEGSIGRPHVAKIMLRKGYVQSIQEAFDKYLKKGAPAYMDKVKLDETDAIKMIKDAKGLAILAHPHQMNYDTFAETREKILELVKLGLDGLEVYYSTMNGEYSEKLVSLAREKGLAMSGGSDFHGANKEGIRMGTGRGNLRVPDEIYYNLKHYWKQANRSTDYGWPSKLDQKEKRMQNLLVPPHGGELKPLLLAGEELIQEKREAENCRQVRLNSRETSDLIMLGIGAFSPLTGFMNQKDYQGVVENMHMSDGTLWPIPITLAVEPAQADQTNLGDKVSLIDDESGELMGTMVVEEKFSYDKKKEARLVFRTEDEAHPGVAKIYNQPDVYLAGPVKVLSEGPYPRRFGEAYARPAETREIFQERGWKTIAAFQTRNPIHRSHEYCTKIAMEICDGVLIHPLVGKLKEGDIPADLRMKCYEVLLENYYPKDRVVLKVYPMEMRYGGPREAVLHAIFRQNFGCSHLIIGRDHAGVGNYYGPFDAQKIFEEIGDNELHIQPLLIDWTFWCHKCDGMASMKTCPHGKEDRVLISGTKLREMLANGEMPPKEFSRPEVARLLMEGTTK